jgi:biopolymer transport protein TolR
MAMTTSGGGGYNSDINVTPLVDVVLVLLIIFMVITPLTQMGYDVQIPKENISTVPPDPAAKQVILAIAAKDCPITAPIGGKDLPNTCVVRLNKVPVDLAQLGTRVTELMKNRPATSKILFLAAEESLNYEAVMKVLDLAKAGSEDLQVGIVSDPGLATSAADPAADPAAVPTL